MAIRTSILMVGLALLACARSEPWATRSPEEVDGPDLDAGGAADAGHDEDGGEARDAGWQLPPDAACAEARHWRLEPRRLTSIGLVEEAFEEAELSRFGATDRLLLEVDTDSSCERLGKMDVHVMPGGATDFVQVQARVWTAGDDCWPAIAPHRAVVPVAGRTHGNFQVIVADASNPGVALHYSRQYCSGVPDCQCTLATPPGPGTLGSDCRTDCSCAEGLSCVGYRGFAGLAWSCLRPCSDALDCAPGETCPPEVMDGPAYTCMAGGGVCLDDSDCPDELVCLEGACAPPSNQAGRPCSCDGQCPRGQHCAAVGESSPTCQYLCSRDSECPANRPRCTGLSVCER